MKNVEFYGMIADILKTPRFQQMKCYRHHVRSNAYEHSLKVAYLCYRHHKRYGGRIPIEELVRGALLHDYYLYDCHAPHRDYRKHLLRHPSVALKNAVRDYPTLTAAQRDMIRHHMFPLSLLHPPRTAAGWLVCFYDKVAAVSDRFGTRRKGE